MSARLLHPRVLPLLLLAALSAPEAAARQWYELYQEGLALLEHGQAAAALAAFEAAAELAPEPRARVRTYGTQFLFAYDPAYQRARCLAALGRLDEARALLAEAEAAGVTAPELVRALRERLAPEPPPVSAEPPPAPAPVPAPAAERPVSNAGEPPANLPPPAPPPAPAVAETTPTTGAPGPAPALEGKLAVRSTPAGARVFVDGRARGLTPSAATPLPPGRHGVRLVLAGHQPWEEVVEIRAAETFGLEVALSPLPAPPPLPSNPTPPAATPADGAEPAGSRAEPPRSLWPWAGGALAAGAIGILSALWSWHRGRRRGRSQGSTGWHARLLGARLGGYELTAELGRGGMASTFRARRLSDGRTVALKVPHPSGDPHFEERFLREGKLGEALHHPAIVRILEAGAERGIPYLAMELVEGRTLKAEIEAHPEGLPLERTLAITRAIAEALDYAHGKGVIHRDLKPENVMLAADGAVKVLDFGVARLEGQPGLTSSQFFLGSPLYAAPEAIEPQRIDHRADLYSLGVLLFEMLEGKPPFVHASVFKLLELHREEPLPERASLPRPLSPEVWAVLSRLCAKSPDDRFPSAEALLVELGRLVDRPNGGQAR